MPPPRISGSSLPSVNYNAEVALFGRNLGGFVLQKL